MITVNNAEIYLKDKIGENSNDIIKVWEEFKSFGKQPVEGEDEIALLFQCGVYDFTGENRFYYDFVRQFSIYKNGEYSHLEQLHCQFLFEVNKELKKLKKVKWYFDYEGDVEIFYKKIESLKHFKIPLTHKPIQVDIFKEEI
ncbi:hypothetical protein [Paenisporosarcina sp.]|uniref:hypothetical protein n=1 Tax=Paenisporosarcina sp. TaxID=1932001 RepID=UPI003C75D084